MRSPRQLQPFHESNERIVFLDFLRSFAILAVILHHFRHIEGAPEGFQWLSLRGYIGVDIFFVLSGWLIGGQLIREQIRFKKINVARFWVRRWLRTLPVYYVMLGAMVFLGRVPSHSLNEMIFFLQGYTDPHGWLITWSLCIEEHFYLFIPPIIILLGKMNQRFKGSVVGLVVLAVLFSPLMRWLSYAEMTKHSYGWFLGEFYAPTHLRLEGLVIGVALAAACEYRTRLWNWLAGHPTSVGLIGAALVLGATWTPHLTGWTSTGAERMRFYCAVPHFLLVSLGTGFLIVAGTTASWSRKIKAPGVRWISDHAYTLYLTHLLALSLVSKWLSAQSYGFWWMFIAALAVSCVMATVLRAAVEVPGLRLRSILVDGPTAVTRAAPRLSRGRLGLRRLLHSKAAEAQPK